MTWTHKGNPVETLPLGAVGFLYLIITAENRYYIGQTTSKTWVHYWGGGHDLKRYYQKNGKDGTRRIIIQFFNDEVELDKAEEHLCALVGAKENPKYYNLKDGGRENASVSNKTKLRISGALTGKKISTKTRMKMSSSAKKRKPPSLKTRAKLSAAGKGRKFTLKRRAKISASRIGKKHSMQTIAKMSASKKGIPTGRRTNTVLTENQAMAIKHVVNTREMKWGDVTKISKMFGVCPSNIQAIKSGISWPDLPNEIPHEDFEK